MAEFLSDSAEHSQFAPLSTAQTVAIAQHLQDQIAELRDRLANLADGHNHAVDQLSELRGSKDLMQQHMGNLQSEHGVFKKILVSTQQELERAKHNIQGLQASGHDMEETLKGLLDEQRASKTHLSKIEADGVRTNALALKLQERVERRVEHDIQTLRDELSKTNLGVKNLGEDVLLNKTIVNEVRDAGRETQSQMKTISSDLSNANTVMHILEQRAVEAAGSLKETRRCLEDHGKVTLKLHEDLCNTNSVTDDLQERLKVASVKLREIGDAGDLTARRLKETASAVRENCASIDTLRSELSQAHTRIISLKEGQGMNSNNISQIRAELADVSQVAHTARSGLKASNALLLPNIHQTVSLGGGMLDASMVTPRRAQQRNATGLKQPSPNGNRGGVDLQWT